MRTFLFQRKEEESFFKCQSYSILLPLSSFRESSSFNLYSCSLPCSHLSFYTLHPTSPKSSPVNRTQTAPVHIGTLNQPGPAPGKTIPSLFPVQIQFFGVLLITSNRNRLQGTSQTHLWS